MNHYETFLQRVEAPDDALYRFAPSLSKSAVDAANLMQQAFLRRADEP